MSENEMNTPYKFVVEWPGLAWREWASRQANPASPTKYTLLHCKTFQILFIFICQAKGEWDGTGFEEKNPLQDTNDAQCPVPVRHIQRELSIAKKRRHPCRKRGDK